MLLAFCCETDIKICNGIPYCSNCLEDNPQIIPRFKNGVEFIRIAKEYGKIC